MDHQLTAAVIFLLLFLTLVVITHLLYSVGRMSSASSRKFIHVTGGILAMFLPAYIHSHWYVLLLCAVSLLLLMITYYKGLLPSIHEVNRISVGSIIFPMPVYICFLFAQQADNMLIFYLPVSLLTFADTMAELGGTKWGHTSFSMFNNQKTFAGSICFAVTACILSVIFLLFIYPINSPRSLILILLITLITTASELVTLKGYDNLSVPLSALLILRFFL